MRMIACVAAAGLALALSSSSAIPQSKNSDLQLVKYDGLKQAVRKNRGKVVIVDFWGDF